MAQFSIRHILLLTAVVAVLLALGRDRVGHALSFLPSLMMASGIGLLLYFSVVAEHRHGPWLGLFYSLALLVMGFFAQILFVATP